MSCRARTLEMSLSLDGRLPSGRRSKLLRHLAQCPRCAATWSGMKKAQDLALSLPAHDVPAGFREGLMRRIEAGEGAPDAVYRDPIPSRVKVRYLASGAVAAALLITAINLLVPAPALPSDIAREQPASDTAHGAVGLGPRETLRPRPAAVTPPNASDAGSPLAFSFQPISEQMLAQRCAQSAASQVRHLRSELRALGNRPLQDAWGQVRPVVAGLEGAIRSLRELDRMEIVALPSTLQTEFREADTLFSLVLRSDSWGDRRVALRELAQLRLERVADNLTINCCRPKVDLLCNLADLVGRVPEVGGMFRVYALGQTSPLPHAAPQNRIMLMLEVEDTPGAGLPNLPPRGH